MAFKLGSSRTQIGSKLSFKESDSSVPGTPVLRKDLKGNILGESNNDGTIFVSNKVQPGSHDENHIIMHEMVHMKDMKLGRLAYDDNYIKWDGETYDRKDGMIFYNNEWAPEGSKHFPWEKMPWE